MTAIVVALCAVLGLAVGSFLNVVVWRVPRGESVVRRPRRARPAARRSVRATTCRSSAGCCCAGRCRSCGSAISRRYPAVELATAALFVVMALRFGTDAALPAYLYLAAVGLALALIDLTASGCRTP
jgi:leader peptidase (prepilin peptidase)/N-methyltransferase